MSSLALVIYLLACVLIYAVVLYLALLVGQAVGSGRPGRAQRYGDTYVIQIEDEAMKDPAA